VRAIREEVVIRYRLFALDSFGRVDRGFEHLCRNDEEAITYAGSILGAAVIEVMRERTLIARVRHHNGQTTVIPAH
jgi:hypothetical protein